MLSIRWWFSFSHTQRELLGWKITFKKKPHPTFVLQTVFYCRSGALFWWPNKSWFSLKISIGKMLFPRPVYLCHLTCLVLCALSRQILVEEKALQKATEAQVFEFYNYQSKVPTKQENMFHLHAQIGTAVKCQIINKSYQNSINMLMLA